MFFSTYSFRMASEHANISAQEACRFLQDGPTFLYANPSVVKVEADPKVAGSFQVMEKLDNPIMRSTSFTSRLEVLDEDGHTMRWTSEAALGVRVTSTYTVSSGRQDGQSESTIRSTPTAKRKMFCRNSSKGPAVEPPRAGTETAAKEVEGKEDEETVDGEKSDEEVVVISEETNVRVPIGFMWYVRWQIDIAHKKFHEELAQVLKQSSTNALKP